jgi:(1->4)-alpha-D-glucan 1-alpha-D-glucosylmutase
VLDFAKAALESTKVCAELQTFVDRVAPYTAGNVLTQKLVQLTMTGVPDVYQGTESEFLALTDPDNRRPVDFAALRALLDAAESPTGEPPTEEPAANESRADEAPAARIATAKLLVTSRALRLRRERPESFAPSTAQTPLFPVGNAAGHAIAFLRGDHVATVGTRLPAGLERAGGWGETALPLPPGLWRCRLTGHEFRVDEQSGVGVPLAQLTAEYPVALLVREEAW